MTYAEDTPVTRARIMVAEDETIIRMDLRQLLESAGFEVCAEARDGLEAVELARSEQPDLAIMDINMPRLDGIEAARQITAERPIPIVMLTAYGEAQLVSRAVDAGAFAYLLKPFREHDVAPAIQTALARHRELVESGRFDADEPLTARLEAIGDELVATKQKQDDWRVAVDLDPDGSDEAIAAWRRVVQWVHTAR